MEVSRRVDMNRQQSSASDAVLHLLRYLNNHMIRGFTSLDRGIRSSFIPLSSVNNYFKDVDRLRRILTALAPTASVPVSLETIQPRYVRVLCILVQLDKGSFLPYFTRHPSLSDQFLPFTQEPEHFPKTFFNDFKAAQWKFCARELRRHDDVQYDSDEILPITDMEWVADGGTSVISKIRIHEEYDLLCPDATKDDSQAHTYALKTYKSNGGYDSFHYKNETDAFARLSRVDMRDSHIVDFYMGFRHGETYSIIMEFAASGTLEELFQREPPKEEGDIMQFWKSLLLGMSKALVRLHESDSCYGWHQDVKPSNILITSSNTDSPWDLSFKLTDFGLSYFTPAISYGEIQRAIGRDSLGTSDYGAPECARTDNFTNNTDLRIDQSVDIWSLGCILYEAATWVCSSQQGLKSFRELRHQTTMPMEQVVAKYAFHDTRRVLTVVREHHKSLSKKTSDRRNYLTSAILETIIPQMLRSSPLKRLSALQVHNHADDIIMRSRYGYLESSQESLYDATRAPMSERGHRDDRKHGNSKTLSGPLTLETDIQQEDPLHMALLHKQDQTREDEHIYCKTGTLLSPDSPTPAHEYADTRAEDDAGVNIIELASDPSSFRVEPSPCDPGAQVLSHKRIDSGSERPGVIGEREENLVQPSSVTQASNRSPHQQPEPRNSHFRARDNSKLSLPVVKPVQAYDWVVTKGYKLAQYNCDKDLNAWGLKDLYGRDHIFLLDDAQTMGDHWPSLKNLCRLLFTIVKDCDKNGVDFYFTVSENDKKYKKKTKSIKTIEDFNAMIEERRPQNGPCNISSELGKILEAYQGRCRRRYRSKFLDVFSKVRPTSLYILTDGRWELESDLTAVIQTQVEQMINLGVGKQNMGIQLINWGDDPEIQNRLNRLDNSLGTKFDIVDTERADGNVVKMLLGPIHSLFDGDSESPQ